MSFFPAERTNSAPPNRLAGFEGQFRNGGKRGKSKEERGEEKKKQDGRDGRIHPSLK